MHKKKKKKKKTSIPKQTEALTLLGDIMYNWFSYICRTCAISW